MTTTDPLFVGRFVAPDGTIRYRDQQPVCVEPFDHGAFDRVAAGWGDDRTYPPAGWRIEIGADHLLVDRHAAPPDALRFVAAYAAEAGAQIMDLGSLRLVEPAALVRTADERTRRRRRHPPPPDSDEAAHEYLTDDGRVPIDYFFVSRGFVCEWWPDIAIPMSWLIDDNDLATRCLEYLTRRGQVAETPDERRVLAERFGWPNWGKPLLKLKLKPRRPAD